MKSSAFKRWLKRAKVVSPEFSTLSCPLHAEKNQSLQIGYVDEGALLIHCARGCNTRTVLSALGVKTQCSAISARSDTDRLCKGGSELNADFVVVVEKEVRWIPRIELALGMATDPVLKALVDYSAKLPFTDDKEVIRVKPSEDTYQGAVIGPMILHVQRA